MGSGWSEERFAEYKLRLNPKSSLSVWELIDLVGVSYFSRNIDQQTLSMGITEVFNELILDVLKQVRQDDILCVAYLSMSPCLPPSTVRFTGIHVKKGPREEELDGALVCPSAHHSVILRL